MLGENSLTKKMSQSRYFLQLKTKYLKNKILLIVFRNTLSNLQSTYFSEVFFSICNDVKIILKENMQNVFFKRSTHTICVQGALVTHK